MVGYGFAEIVNRIIKYLIEGLVIAAAAIFIPKKALPLDEVDDARESTSDKPASHLAASILREAAATITRESEKLAEEHHIASHHIRTPRSIFAWQPRIPGNNANSRAEAAALACSRRRGQSPQSKPQQ
jgi:hypothetical protein